MNQETETELTDEEVPFAKIQVGISSCLLGQEVRFDGGHKRDSYVMGQYYLSPHPKELILRNRI